MAKTEMQGASTENVTGWQQRIAGVVQPENVQDVIDLVMDARQHGTALYPYSTGLNWGYGSRSPVRSDSILVDLSRMNRILNGTAVSAEHPVVVVEPGVTQDQLFAFLQSEHPDLTFNVSGAAGCTSLLGNALDRGVGYFGPRREDLFGLELVAGTGEILRTGFRRLGEDSPLAHCHPYGLGPMLDGLFFQGNYGIVTSGCFRLIPRRPKEVAVSLGLRNPADLGEFISILARLKREGLLTSVTHIGNRARTHSTLSYGITSYLESACGYSPEQAKAEAEKSLDIVAPDEWTGLAAVVGNKAQVRAALAEIRSRVKHLARMQVVTDGLLDLGFMVTHALRFIRFARANAAAISAIRPLHHLALGWPTDVPIQNLLWKYDAVDKDIAELDASRCGLLFVNPALPLDGKLVAKVVAGMEEIARSHGHPLYMTLNVETTTSLVAVINLLFDRQDANETERAHACADALLDYLHAEKLTPYRARVDMMSRITSPDDPFWKKAWELKQVFDPDNIIAPGRYNLDPAIQSH